MPPTLAASARAGNPGPADAARLDDGTMWANAFAVVAITPEVEERITALVRRATA